MREIRPSGSMSGKWNRSMVAILWHSQTKGRATVNTNSNLNPAPVLDSTDTAFGGVASGNFALTSQNLRWRHLVALARVPASEFGREAAGHHEACDLPGSTQRRLGLQSSRYDFSLAGNAAVKILVSAAEIQASVESLAAQIREREGNRPLTVIAIMTGSIVFLADLIRKLEMPLRVGVVQTSSYRGTARGPLTINAGMMPDITDKDVLLVDDIFDTGRTLQEVIASLADFRPRSLRSAVLLLKRGRQEVDLRPDYVGFEIPDEFVVGYGLDYNDQYRNLPYLGVLEPSDLAGPTS